MKYFILTLLAINLTLAEDTTKTETKADDGSKAEIVSKNKICGEKYITLTKSEEDFKKDVKDLTKDLTAEFSVCVQLANDESKKFLETDSGKDIAKDIKAGDKGENEKRPGKDLAAKAKEFLENKVNQDETAANKDKEDLKDAKKTHPACMIALTNVTVGYKCVTESKEGKEQKKEVSTGQAQFTMNTKDAVELWKTCSFAAFPLCEAVVLDEYTANALGEKLEEKKGRSKKLEELCTAIANDSACTESTLDKCGDTVKNTFASIVTVVGNRSNSYCAKSNRDKRKKMRDERGKKIPPKKGGTASGNNSNTDTKGNTTKADEAKNTARILIARYLEAANEGDEVEILVSSSGESLIELAGKTAIDTKTIWESAKVLVTSVLTAFFVVMTK